MPAIFLWEQWGGRLSPVVLHHEPIGAGAYLLRQREIAGSRHELSEVEQLLGLDALAKLYPAPITVTAKAEADA